VAEAALALNKTNPDSSIRDFRKLTQQADSRNLKFLSLESSVDAAEAVIARKDYADAERGLQAAMGKSEKLGSRYQSARIHYLLGEALRLSGNKTDASQQYAAALGLMNEMQKDAGAEKLLERSDLKAMFTQATRFATAKD
jgi:tetratricopeptide (TPR) repeat protein